MSLPASLNLKNLTKIIRDGMTQSEDALNELTKSKLAGGRGRRIYLSGILNGWSIQVSRTYKHPHQRYPTKMVNLQDPRKRSLWSTEGSYVDACIRILLKELGEPKNYHLEVEHTYQLAEGTKSFMGAMCKHPKVSLSCVEQFTTDPEDVTCEDCLKMMLSPAAETQQEESA